MCNGVELSKKRKHLTCSQLQNTCAVTKLLCCTGEGNGLDINTHHPWCHTSSIPGNPSTYCVTELKKQISGHKFKMTQRLSSPFNSIIS